ncbi:MAG TPA: 6-phosphogluconolactonase [Methylophilaceae bacterium]|nr:6-phosphogluconolactonase [Methylophilaceae bacterium]
MQKSDQLTLANHQLTRWFSFDNQQAINEAAVDRILQSASSAIASRGRFLLVLAGGGTPKNIYALLRSAQADWQHWHIFYNDDRCLPVDHPDRNSLMAREAWLQHVPIPASQIHDIPTELGPVEGAKSYAQTLEGVGDFDLVLLGLGEDGHTASLFPGKDSDDSVDAFPVFDAPKPPPERVTISAARLSRTRDVLFLVTGAGKQEPVDNWRQGQAIPATLITPQNGVDVYCQGIILH